MIFEAEGVVAFLLLAFWIWALFDCIATDSALCRNLPKGVWLLVVIFLFDIGSLAWLILGRPEKARWRPGSTDYSSTRRPIAIEDDPRYAWPADVSERRSAELDARLERWEREQRALEQQSEPKRELAAGPSPAEPPGPADPSDLDAWQAELDRREADLRRRELERREQELERRRRELDQG